MVQENTISINKLEKHEILKNSKNKWIQCGNIILSQRDKLALRNGKMLSDMHINAAQQLLKKQFRDINGLQSTLYQLKSH